MTYARLNGQKLISAPTTVIIDNMTVCNPTEKQYIKIGYFPIIYTDAPECVENMMAISHWEQKGNEIIQVWKIEPIPEYTLEPIQPTKIDIIEAQITYTAMMTDTMLEGTANV